MESPCQKPSEVRFTKFLEYIAIVGCGLYLHLNRISILDLKITKLPGLCPSFASTIFIFSILSLFAIGKPSWPSQPNESRKIIKFLIELSLIMYSVDLLMRHFWVPCLKLISFFCKTSSRYLKDKSPILSSWLADYGYYTLKCLIALAVFSFMLEVVGFHEALRSFYRKIMTNYEAQKTPPPVIQETPQPEPAPVYQRRTRSRSRRRAYDQELRTNSYPNTRNTLLSNIWQSPRVQSILDIVKLNRNSNQCEICHQSL